MLRISKEAAVAIGLSAIFATGLVMWLETGVLHWLYGGITAVVPLGTYWFAKIRYARW